MVVDFNNVSSQPTVRPTKLAHFVLRTNNLKPMAAFYLQFLGGTESHGNDIMSFITYDDEHHRLAIAQIPSLKDKDPNTCGLEHIAFTFNSLEDLFIAYRQRKAKGILPFWCINHGLTVSLYYYDPDRNVLETQYDIFDENGKANEYMLTEEFEKNPIGAEFDPEEFIKRIESGESLESLTTRPNVGPKGLEAVPTMPAYVKVST